MREFIRKFEEWSGISVPLPTIGIIQPGNSIYIVHQTSNFCLDGIRSIQQFLRYDPSIGGAYCSDPLREQDPILVVREICDANTIIHEMVHHLQYLSYPIAPFVFVAEYYGNQLSQLIIDNKALIEGNLFWRPDVFTMLEYIAVMIALLLEDKIDAHTFIRELINEKCNK